MYSHRFALVITIIFISTMLSALGQDRLITTVGDTVYCKIERIDGQYLIFTVDHDSQRERKIAFSLVDGYDRNYLKQPKDEAPEKPTPEKPAYEKPRSIYTTQPSVSPTRRSKKKGFMLGIAVGYSHRIAKISEGLPDELEKYIRKLKSGFALKIDAAYFFGRYFGLGAKYSMAYSGNRLSNISFQDQKGNIIVGDIADHISMHFMGLHLTSRGGPRSGNGHFLPGITLGYTAYQNKATVIDAFTLTSGTFSVGVDLVAEFKVGRGTYLGFGADYITGILNHYNYKDATPSDTITMEGDARDNLSRIEFETLL